MGLRQRNQQCQEKIKLDLIACSFKLIKYINIS